MQKIAFFLRKLLALMNQVIQEIHKYTSSSPGAKKPAPGSRYNKYNHSDEHEHRTAEQFSWKHQKIISSFTLGFAILAVVFAYETFVETRRQAVAAEKNLPRAWLYVEYPRMPEPPLIPNQDGFTIPARIHNYFQTPADIISIDAWVYTQDGGSDSFPIAATKDDIRIDGLTKSMLGEWMRSVRSATIGPNSDLTTYIPEAVAYSLPPNVGHHVAPNRWIQFTIRYSDPYGHDRETGFLLQIDSQGYGPVNDERYNYHR